MWRSIAVFGAAGVLLAAALLAAVGLTQLRAAAAEGEFGPIVQGAPIALDEPAAREPETPAPNQAAATLHVIPPQVDSDFVEPPAPSGTVEPFAAVETGDEFGAPVTPGDDPFGVTATASDFAPSADAAPPVPDAGERLQTLARAAAAALPEEELNRLSTEIESRVAEATAARRLVEAKVALEKVAAEFPGTAAAASAGRMLRGETCPAGAASPVEAPQPGRPAARTYPPGA